MRKNGFGRGSAVFFSCILCVFAGAALMPGIRYESAEQAILAGALLGAVFVAVRPVLRLISTPIGCLTMGLANVALDVGIIYLCDSAIEGFYVDGPGWALGMSAFVNIICAIAGGRNA